MERPAASDPMKTNGGYGMPREVKAEILTPAARGTVNPGGYVIHEKNKFHESAAEKRAGFEWTGRGFPVSIPEAWIDWLYEKEQKFYRWIGEFFT